MFRLFSKSAEISAPEQPSINHPDINDALISEAFWDKIPACFNEDKYTATQIKNALAIIKSKVYFAAGASDIFGDSRFDQKFIGFLYRLKDKHPKIWETSEEAILSAIDTNIRNGKFDILRKGRMAFIEGSRAHDIFKTLEKRLLESKGSLNLTLADYNGEVLYFSRGGWRHDSADQCVRHWLSYGEGIKALDEIIHTVKSAEKIHQANPQYFKGITGEFQRVMQQVTNEQKNILAEAEKRRERADTLRKWVDREGEPFLQNEVK